MKKTRIEWADATWNPITGCSPISEGCANCYAERIAKRFAGSAGYPADNPFGVTLHEGRMLEPLRWQKPRKIFVCSMGDLFHEDVPDEWIHQVFAVMALASQHTFMALTKRPERMQHMLTDPDFEADVWFQRDRLLYSRDIPRRISQEFTYHHDDFYTHEGALAATAYEYSPGPSVPLSNVWLGVTAENQQAADERTPLLLDTPAAKRFVSCEPLLGPVELDNICTPRSARSSDYMNALDLEEWTEAEAREECGESFMPPLDWVIAGGETGPGARPMHPDWARSLRDQCQAASVPFFFKSWGEWGVTEPYTYLHGGLEGQLVPYTCTDSTVRKRVATVRYYAFPHEYKEGPGQLEVMSKMGKQRAGRLLDGREHNEWPEVSQ